MAPSISTTLATPPTTPPTTPPLDALKSSSALDQPDIRGQTESSNTSQQLSERIVTGLTSRTVPFVPDAKNPNAVTSKDELLRSIPTLVLYDDRGLDLFDQITYLDEYYLTNAEIQVFNDWGDEIISTCVQDGGILVEPRSRVRVSMRKTKFLLEAIVRQNKSVTYYALDLSEQSLVESLKPLAANFPTIRFVGLLGTYEDSLAYISRNVPTHNGDGKRVTRTILWLGSSIGNLTRDEAAEFLGKIAEQVMSVGDTFLCGVDRRNAPADVKLAYDDPQGVTREFIMNGLDHVDRILGGKGIVDRANFEYLSIYNDKLGRHEAYYRTLKAHTLVLPDPSGGADVTVALEDGELINIEYSVKYSPREISRLADRARLNHGSRWTDRSDRYDLHLFVRPPRQVFPTLFEFEQIWKAWLVLKDTVTCTMIDQTNYLEKPISLRHPYIFYLGQYRLSWIFKCRDVLRGIDPDMEDTSKCHPHSKVPDTWPKAADVIAYRDRVRSRVRALPCPARLSRVLWMCYEHDAMHLETILYMLCGPPHLFRTLSAPIKPLPVASFFPSIQANASISLGHDDPEADDADDHDGIIATQRVFGWDNERPLRTVGLKTVYGSVPIANVPNWPVFASHVQAKAYVTHVGASRLPTESEMVYLRRQHPHSQNETVSAPNVGFRSWHPENAEEGTLLGNGWEWTDSIMESHSGFESSSLYPGYTSDFFDEKHNVVLGGSWATAPRIAHRDTFRNWYQRGYPFVFATFRCVF
ncbi:histidine-specific methyltransferase [Chytridium lagenaria]|nr:histidine-specific methyltransferase [Chytridium lagenaria]